MRFLASCFAMTGILGSLQDPDAFTQEQMARAAVECGDALLDELEDKDDGGIAAVAKRVRRKRES
jgi:hypothetical protein